MIMNMMTCDRVIATRLLSHYSPYSRTRFNCLHFNPILYLLQTKSVYNTSQTLTYSWRKNPNSFSHKKPQSQYFPHKSVADWARPNEIAWQSKLANSVNLIGLIQFPVIFDGNNWAATVIAQEDSVSLRIPLIFEGDLAHIAASHLKEKDCIHVDGRLSSDPPPISLIPERSSFKVMVHNINFIEGSSLPRKSFGSQQILFHSGNTKTENMYQKNESKEEVYQRKGSMKDQQYLNVKNKCSKAGMTKNAALILGSWRDLLKDPKQWQDNRENKLKGTVKAKYPDFTHKDSGTSLWLNTAPKWVLPGLQGLEFHAPFQKRKKADDDSWKDLVDNPEKWWDNRSNKFNDKFPDFKHKDSGKALWLDNSPSWAVSKLPPLKA